MASEPSELKQAHEPPAAGGLKPPPPEKPSDIRRRSYIILSFWLLVLLLGLPIWWKTTTIYRADLPLDSMLQWADGKACRPVFPLQISIKADELQNTDAQHLVRLTQHALDDLNDFSGHHLRLQLAPKDHKIVPPSDDLQLALSINLTPGDATSASLDPHSAALDITYPPNSIPSPNAASSTLATFIANELRATFAEEQSIISYLLSKSSMSGPRPQGLTNSAIESLEKRTTRSLRYAPTYHLSFSLFTDGPVPNTWGIEAAVEEYMQPMLDVLGPIHNFTIDTQLQLYATPGVQSQVLNKDDLASFINAAEWPLSPSIGGAPTVNFIIFVGNQTIGLPDSDAQTSQSWMIPQWGTVYLLPLPGATSHVSKDILRQPMLTFGGHLLSLLGTPPVWLPAPSPIHPLAHTICRPTPTRLLNTRLPSPSLPLLTIHLHPPERSRWCHKEHGPPGASMRQPRWAGGIASRAYGGGGSRASIFREEYGGTAVLPRRA